MRREGHREKNPIAMRPEEGGRNKGVRKLKKSSVGGKLEKEEGKKKYQFQTSIRKKKKNARTLQSQRD